MLNDRQPNSLCLQHFADKKLFYSHYHYTLWISAHAVNKNLPYRWEPTPFDNVKQAPPSSLTFLNCKDTKKPFPIYNFKPYLKQNQYRRIISPLPPTRAPFFLAEILNKCSGAQLQKCSNWKADYLFLLQVKAHVVFGGSNIFELQLNLHGVSCNLKLLWKSWLGNPIYKKSNQCCSSF